MPRLGSGDAGYSAWYVAVRSFMAELEDHHDFADFTWNQMLAFQREWDITVW